MTLQMLNILKQTLPSKKSCTKSCSISPQEFNDFGDKLTSNFGELKELPPCTINTPEEPFEFLTIDTNFVLQELLHLSEKPKLDIIKFDTRLLRISAPIIAPFLTHIYNLSLCTGTLPQDWKVAGTTPVYKTKGDTANPSNYRPISVVSPLAKILEKAIKTQLLSYIK